MIKKKYKIKIPKNIKIIYDDTNDILICLGPLNIKILKLKLKLVVDNSRNLIYVTQVAKESFSEKSKNFLNCLQGTLTSLILQNVLETSTVMHCKLKLTGVGYKVFLDTQSSNILHFKLGFSHFIFFKFPTEIKALCLKSSNLYFFGDSLYQITQLASKIRLYKKPEPYKGKGILYKNEKIKLKEGKKV